MSRILRAAAIALFIVLISRAALLHAAAQDLKASPPASGSIPLRDDPFVRQEAKDANPGSQPGAAQHDLSSRFRFVELYKLSDNQASPGLVEYDVAFREAVRISRENGQAAPSVQQYTRTGRYRERAVELSPIDNRMVSSVLRTYDDASVTPDPWAGTNVPPLASGLSLWLKNLGGLETEILQLAPGRDFYEQEYRFALGNPYLPTFSYLLPEGYVRVGDTWALTRAACAAITAEPVSSGTFTARLAKVIPFEDPERPGVNELATFAIEGRVTTLQGSAALRAHVEFAFREVNSMNEAAEADATKANNSSQPMLAIGGITKIRLAQVDTFESKSPKAAGGETRRELIVERRWPARDATLTLPDPEPTASPENSWLTYVEPKRLFSLRHPPNYTIGAAPIATGGEQITLMRPREGGMPDRLTLTVEPGKAVRLDSAFEPEFEQYRQVGYEVLPGETKTLPADEWGGMEVQRINAALTSDRGVKPGQGRAAARLHFDGYLMPQAQNIAVLAYVLSASDDATALRDDAESILKTFKLTAP